MNKLVLLISLAFSNIAFAQDSGTLKCTTIRPGYEKSALNLFIFNNHVDYDFATLKIEGVITRNNGRTMRVSDVLEFDHLNGDAYSGEKFSATLVHEEDSDEFELGLHWLYEPTYGEEEPSTLGRKIATFICK